MPLFKHLLMQDYLTERVFYFSVRLPHTWIVPHLTCLVQPQACTGCYRATAGAAQVQGSLIVAIREQLKVVLHFSCQNFPTSLGKANQLYRSTCHCSFPASSGSSTPGWLLSVTIVCFRMRCKIIRAKPSYYLFL